MNDLFHIIQDAHVVLRMKNGVYRQAKVYRRGNRFYAGYGAGFIRLGSGDATSCPNISYESLDLPFEAQRGTIGEPLLPALAATIGKAA